MTNPRRLVRPVERNYYPTNCDRRKTCSSPGICFCVRQINAEPNEEVNYRNCKKYTTKTSKGKN